MKGSKELKEKMKVGFFEGWEGLGHGYFKRRLQGAQGLRIRCAVAHDSHHLTAFPMVGMSAVNQMFLLFYLWTHSWKACPGLLVLDEVRWLVLALKIMRSNGDYFCPGTFSNQCETLQSSLFFAKSPAMFQTVAGVSLGSKLSMTLGKAPS